jgi:hypothetical protein
VCVCVCVCACVYKVYLVVHISGSQRGPYRRQSKVYKRPQENDGQLGDSTNSWEYSTQQIFINNNQNSYSRYSDSLRPGGSRDRIPVEARFFQPIYTGPEARPASCAMGTGSFLGVKRPARGVNHPLPSSPIRTANRRQNPDLLGLTHCQIWQQLSFRLITTFMCP